MGSTIEGNDAIPERGISCPRREEPAETATKADPRWPEIVAWLEAGVGYAPYLSGTVYGVVRHHWVPYGAAYADHLTPLGVELMEYLDAWQERDLNALRAMVGKIAVVPWYYSGDPKDLLRQVPTMNFYQLQDMLPWPTPGYVVAAFRLFYDQWLRYRGY